jgi:hypothetical protein
MRLKRKPIYEEAELFTVLRRLAYRHWLKQRPEDPPEYIFELNQPAKDEYEVVA